MERTILVLQPNVIKFQNEIIHTIKQNGFVILSKRDIQLTEDEIIDAFGIGELSDIDTQRSEMVDYYSSGPVIVLLLLKLNAINDLKNILGIKDFQSAKQFTPSCLRAKYGTSTLKNAFYCSENDESAKKDSRFFFPDVKVDPPVDPLINKAFLDNSVYPVLTKGLTELCKEKPLNPISFLGEWLIRNNPNVPKIAEAESKNQACLQK